MSINRNIGSAILLLLAILIGGWSAYVAHEAKEESRARRNRMQVVRELLADDSQGIVVLAPSGRIIEWSPGATAIFGWTLSEVAGSYPDFLMPPELWKRHEAKLAARASGKVDPHRVSSVICWAITKTNELVQVHVVVSSFRNHVGYNHIAIIAKQDNYVRLADTPKPTDLSKIPKPCPTVVELPPGVYTPFTE